MAHGVEDLVGRATELGLLDGALAEVGRSRPVAVALLGEPGIGKTRLMTELGERADARGALVLSGSASEFERDLPFWVFVDALDEYVQSIEPRRLAGLDGDAQADLGQVLPSLARDGRSGPLQAERYRTHRAVRALLEVLARPKPLVLLLDDLHWADSGTIELLGGLLRRPPAGAVLTAFTVRPRQVPERLAGALERAHRAGGLLRIEVGALSPAEAAELVGSDALYEQSGGNPFYLQQLARAPQRPAGAAPGARVAGLPPTVGAALTDELALLDDRPRRVLEGAAVAGDPFEPELAGAAAGIAEHEALEALDELLGRDLVRPTDVPRRFRFRHPLVRLAVYEAAPGGWRLGAHERCAEALRERGAPAAARAHHVEHAARHGDAEAIAVLREAAEAVLHRTPAGAANWLAAALRLLPHSAPAAERIGLLSSLAGALAATGRFEEAHAALVEASASVADVGLIVACARVELLLTRYADAAGRLERALGDVADQASPAAITLMLELSTATLSTLENSAARAWAIRALEAARSNGERSLIASAAASCAFVTALQGDVAEAERHRSEAAAVIDAMSDEEVARSLSALAQTAGAELYIDRLGESLAHYERAVRVARASGQGQLFPTVLPLLGALLNLHGRLEEAAAVLDGAIEAGRLARNRNAIAWALYHRAHAALVAGDLETARRTGQESLELAREIEGSIVSCFAALILGWTLMESGDPARGLELMVGHAGGEDLALVGAAWRAFFLEIAVAGWVALGRREQAERAAAAAEAIAASTGLRFAAFAALRARARVALDAGDAHGAAERSLESAALGGELGMPIYAAVSRTLAGRALAAAGEGERAAAELARAAEELDARGALRYRDEAEHELRRLGHRRLHRRTRAGTADGTGVQSLTERELQIARLVVDRKTNSQIAAELFLSPKTVETHIRNLFHKLDVSSRVDVARVVERADQGP